MLKEKIKPTYLESTLDEALEESFPASDPVAISVTSTVTHEPPEGSEKTEKMGAEAMENEGYPPVALNDA